MKTWKFLLPVAALFVSATAMAQKGHSKSHTTTHRVGTEQREEARTNGSLNANAHASEQARQHANENSVLNGDGSAVQTKYKTKIKRVDADRRKSGKKTKAKNQA